MDKISSIKKRILQFIDYKGIKKKDFCDRTKISYSNMRGKSLESEIGGEALANIIIEYDEISPIWLLTGKGEMLNIETKENPELQDESLTGKEKILQYLDYKRIKKSDFYHKTGFSNGFLDSGKHIGTDNLKTIISHYPDLSLEWFVMDIGNMIKNNQNIDYKEVSHEEIELYKEIIISKNKEIEAKQEMINSLLDHINTLKKMSFLGNTKKMLDNKDCKK